MKSLNVNGDLVTKLECREFLECVNEDDLILVSETWTNKEHSLKIDGYAEPVCKHRVKKVKAKRESGGLVWFFSKNV